MSNSTHAPDLIPRDIAAVDEALRIEWSDGHQGIYPFRELRLACLCAGCVDEWTRKPLLKPETVSAHIKPLKADYVGRYALSIEWSDGHNTGIYSFDYLRAICQCPDCRNARPAQSN